MLFQPVTQLIFMVDEYFTIGIVKLPILQGIIITANDVHPPLYYLILKLILKLLNTLNISYNLIFVLKILSMVPYLILYIFFGVRLRKEYGWMAIGLMSFTLISMSIFFISYLTIRMYPLALLFLVFQFIYLKDVIFKSDMKSWFLFSIFALLSAYTHYFTAIASVILFLLVLIRIIYNKSTELNKKSEIKKWLVSVFCLILAYMPWMFILLKQLHSVHDNFWVSQIDLSAFIELITSFFVGEGLLFQFIAILCIILFTLILFIDFKSNENDDMPYLLIGFGLFFVVIIVGTVISFLFKPIIIVRYLMPMIGVFWISISILISRIKNDKLFSIVLIFILVAGFYGVYDTLDTCQNSYIEGRSYQKCINEIDQLNNSVICMGYGSTLQFGTFMENATVYATDDLIYGIEINKFYDLYGIKYLSDIDKIIENNHVNDIYFVKGSWIKNDFVDNNTTIIGNIEGNYFYSL